ncbi:MAG TPA: hypothetical protein VKY57_10190 [Chitinispirillaceae bacterium]|jgi:hypothetical protein|nr:hypothetical protein [Chitinispirillaceae bacterium]
MPKYAVAFIVPSETSLLRHRVLDGENKDAALRKFFTEEVSEYYSNDEQGFYYFKEDFFDETSSTGSIIEL